MIDDDDLIRRLKALPRREPSDRLLRRVHALPQAHAQAEKFSMLMIRFLSDWQYRPALKIACLVLILAGGFAAGQLQQAQSGDVLSGFILGGVGVDG